MKEYYNIEDIAKITMLSTRTLRNYITQGLLCGEKVNGVWRFTNEDLESFLNEDFVKQAIQSKNNGIVYDYLSNYNKNEDSVCSIFDYNNLDQQDAQILCDKFIDLVNSNKYGNIRFSYSYKGKKKLVRVILTGSINGVYSLMNDFPTL